MPLCHITISENANIPEIDTLNTIRDIIAKALDSEDRYLDREHISIRIHQGFRKIMLADIEIEIFAQLYKSRYHSRDERANEISEKTSKVLNKDCATWINLCTVGYSRVTKDGETFYSD